MYCDFGEVFSETSFVYGAGYGKTNRIKWELLNFLSGEAKFAIYITRRNRVEDRPGQDPLCMWLGGIRCRIRLEFMFYSAMDDLQIFQGLWGYRDLICCYLEGRLEFSGVFAT